MNLDHALHAASSLVQANGTLIGILAFLVYQGLDEYLPRTQRFKANTVMQALANTAKQFLLDRVPLVRILVNSLATPDAAAPPPAATPPTPPPPPPPQGGQRGSADVLVLLGLVGVVLLSILFCGCASAVKQTAVAEDGLARLVAVGYQEFTGYDKQMLSAIGQQADNGDAENAKANLDGYTPRRQQALKVLDGAADLIQAADLARAGIEKGTADPKNFTAYLPTLLQAVSDVRQALLDLGISVPTAKPAPTGGAK